jgi:tripartite-type tricarboxylate transporter receptor subunit TctC
MGIEGHARLRIGLAVAIFAASLGDGAKAQSIEQFYAGRSIDLYVGAGAGGGYDLYARLLARHMGNHMPGSPSFVVKNMQGAAGLKSANSLWSIAPKDGSAIGLIMYTLTINQLAGGRNVEFDMRKFRWIGSMNTVSTICAFTAKAGIKSVDDLLGREIVIGAATGGGSTAIFPQLLNRLVGTKFKVIKGYDATSGVTLAMEKGEVDGLCGWGWDVAASQASQQFEKKIFVPWLNVAVSRHPVLDAQGVPFVMDLVKDGENKQILEMVLSPQYYGRPYAAPPGTPEDRLAALRKAFAATLADAKLLDEAEKAQIEVQYLEPEKIDAEIAKSFAAPEAIKKRAIEELTSAGWSGLN